MFLKPTPTGSLPFHSFHPFSSHSPLITSTHYRPHIFPPSLHYLFHLSAASMCSTLLPPPPGPISPIPTSYLFSTSSINLCRIQSSCLFILAIFSLHLGQMNILLSIQTPLHPLSSSTNSFTENITASVLYLPPFEHIPCCRPTPKKESVLWLVN